MNLPNAYYFLGENRFDCALSQIRGLFKSVVEAENCFEIGNDENADGVTLWVEAKRHEGFYIGILLSFPTKELEKSFSLVCKMIEENGGTRLDAIEFSRIIC